ncbi:uncharacterized protein LOC127795114 isoform X3 [Diospyros lotus]|uniref:uncharacterized protein LOC127795114 isoform X3 n=1 Tax=Diospyros lotus TaxID=55363 RepID=UPI0022520F6D|nr:uncharacterized protein LOC127795114 isoform X3 [Diospyros lotus]
MDETTFDPDLIHAIFKLVWSRRALEREKNDCIEALEGEVRISLAFLIQWAIGLYSTRNAEDKMQVKSCRSVGVEMLSGNYFPSFQHF